MKRYDLLSLQERKDGDYVRYTDAAAIEQERDRLRGQRDRLADICRSNIWAFEHHNCMSEQCDACDLDAILAEIEKESP